MIHRDRFRQISFVCVSTVVLVGAACTPTKKEQPKVYTLHGTVVKLDRETNLATIKGEKIPGWMAAMTMEYPVQDRNQYLSLHAGEKIEATVNVTSEGYWLTNVQESKGD